MAYQLPKGVSSMMLPGVGIVSAGQTIEGAFGHLVGLGILVEVPSVKAAVTVPAPAPVKPAPAPVVAPAVEIEPEPESVLVEELPEEPVLTDTSSTAQAEVVVDPHPFEDLPPVRAPGKGKPQGRRK